MKKYALAVIINVEVSAPNLSDAKECVHEVFGEAVIGDIEITDYEVVDSEELS